LIFNLIKKVAWHWEVPLRKLRAELGMPPARQSALFEGQFSPFGNLALFDSVLAEPQPDWPVNTTVCGSPCFDGQILDPSHTVELETFLAAGPPPVVFALGSSAVWVAGDFWEKAVQAVQKLGLRAILVTGPQTPQGLPDGVCALPYLPYSHVFPKAAVVVHQAGVGTLAQALRASCPQLIVPLAFDQADNGQRAERLKLARVIPFRKVTVRGLVETLDHLLKNPEYAQNAWRVAALLAPQDGAALAAEELIRLAG
jgi:UDP:flavonoid glycosyltransferase YjiC (YdhE family)